ncbi:YoaK family protein [Falsiroseomonas sp. HW251]|uniref:YoaK family protein n=1 Tax=Falsiroseomonas sp. HW251 TaxID=3390998 RepID=UPI003D31928C
MSGAAPPRLDALPGAMLSFAAGFVDVVGFVALQGLFTAHVTGNFVLIGAEAAGLSAGGVVGKLLALPVFAAAVACTRLMLRGRASGSLRHLLVAEIAFLVLFLLLGLLASPVRDADAPLAILAGMAGVVAMGIQNAGARILMPTAPPTTIMTGNTTQVVIDLTDLPGASADAQAAAGARLRRMLPAVGSFAAGAILGALGYAALGFWALLIPVMALAALVMRAARAG